MKRRPTACSETTTTGRARRRPPPDEPAHDRRRCWAAASASGSRTASTSAGAGSRSRTPTRSARSGGSSRSSRWSRDAGRGARDAGPQRRHERRVLTTGTHLRGQDINLPGQPDDSATGGNGRDRAPAGRNSVHHSSDVQPPSTISACPVTNDASSEGEERDRSRDVLRLTEPLDGLQREELPLGCRRVGKHLDLALRTDRTRRDHVDRDMPSTRPREQASREAQRRALGGDGTGTALLTEIEGHGAMLTNPA